MPAVLGGFRCFPVSRCRKLMDQRQAIRIVGVSGCLIAQNSLFCLWHLLIFVNTIAQHGHRNRRHCLVLDTEFEIVHQDQGRYRW